MPRSSTSSAAPAKPAAAAAPSTPDLAPLLGAHMSTAGGVDKAIERALSVGCTAMQIFVKNNMQWFAQSPFAKAELDTFHHRSAELGSIFGHSGYMINLAASNPEFLEKSRQALAEELKRAHQLRLPFLVLHPGAHTGAGVPAGLEKVVQSLDLMWQEIPEVETKVALECTAGQGTCLGCDFEHLGEIIRGVKEPHRLCVCIDTAHLFAAGYDISTAAGARETFAKFDQAVGRKWLAALHLNDSKAALGSRVDRHDHIGQGKIGLEGFRYIMNEPSFRTLPKVLETPKGKELTEDVMNLNTLRGLVAANAAPSKSSASKAK